MSVWEKVKQLGKRLSLAPDTNLPPPVLSAIDTTFDFFAKQWEGNKYQRYQALIDNDPELAGAIMSYSFMVYKAYNGIDTDVEGLEGEGLQNVIDACNDFVRRIDLPSRFLIDTAELLTYGDRIYHIVIEDNKVTKLEPWPVAFVTILEDPITEGQMPVLAPGQIIQEANYYVLNESSANYKYMIVEDSTDMLHISLAKEGTLVQDIRNRWTLGIWSQSPIRSLELSIRWKMNSIYNDILWRNRNLPRELHKLDLSAFDPTLFPGDANAKIAAAQAAAKTAIDDYSKSLAKMKADQGYVISKDNSVEYVEPKSTTYQAPNELLAQINRSIGHALGIDVETPRTFAGLVQSGSFSMMRAQVLAEVVKKSYERLLWDELQRLFPALKMDTIRQFEIRLKLILEKDKSELARQIAVLTTTKSFTPTEVRAVWGFDPLTDKQKQELKEFLSSTAKQPAKQQPGQSPSVQSPTEIAADITDRRLPKDIRPIRYPSEKERTQKT